MTLARAAARRSERADGADGWRAHRRRLLLATSACLAPTLTFAQPAARTRVVGVLGNVHPDDPGDPFRLFVAALVELGWVEGRTVTFVYRGADQPYERFPELARELVRLGVDLIVVTAGVTAALAAKAATATIPILAIGVADPVKFGLVASLAHPGGNVTGFASTSTDWGKYLELTHEAVPGASRVAIIANPGNVGYADYAAANETAARQLGLRLQLLPVAQPGDLAAAFEAMRRERAEALVFGPDRVFLASIREIVERAQAQALPVIAPVRSAAQAGALISYGLDGRAMLRLAASYADRLLKGTKPADLPIEQPTRFELVVNLKAANTLGLKVPSSLRLRADEVIE
jgi:putative ABC transport system substrate-binding protein|nr:ABC transporter substrate-binding protein [Caldimonas sp.]